MINYPRIAEPETPSQMESLTRDQSIRLSAQRQERSARVSLAMALVTLGQFDEALALGVPEKEAFIQSVKAADEAPDDARCNCVYLIDRADYTRNENSAPRMEPGKKYLQTFRYWSPNYHEMVWYYVCLKCGHANSLPGDINA